MTLPAIITVQFAPTRPFHIKVEDAFCYSSRDSNDYPNVFVKEKTLEKKKSDLSFPPMGCCFVIIQHGSLCRGKPTVSPGQFYKTADSPSCDVIAIVARGPDNTSNCAEKQPFSKRSGRSKT